MRRSLCEVLTIRVPEPGSYPCVSRKHMLPSHTMRSYDDSVIYGYMYSYSYEVGAPTSSMGDGMCVLGHSGADETAFERGPSTMT